MTPGMSQVLCPPFFIPSRASNMIKEESQQATQKSSLILEKLNSLKQEDETLYNILAVDVWALAKTMDEFQPGFWSAFMKNREKALKRFIAETMKNKPANPKRPPFLR
jgi:hypothetical protein